MNKWHINPTTARVLRKINQDGYIVQSSVSKGAVENINLLIDQGILGRDKKRIVVLREDDYARIVNNISDPPKVLNHANAAKFYGDAHKGGKQPFLALLLKTRGPSLWRKPASDMEIEVSTISNAMGIASIAIIPEDDWYCNQPIAFVENEYCLWNCEKFPLPSDITSVIAYHGTADSRLIDWLAFQKRAPKILWCPDYDYVGLNNYLRVKSKADVVLWVPNNLEDILSGPANNPKRLQDQQHLLPSLLKSGDPQVKRIIDLLLCAGGGVDHEAFIK